MKEFEELFKHIYKGDKNATELSLKLLKIAHTWDDIIDKDKPITEAEINQAFIGSLFELQQNPLWFQCGINHHVLGCYHQWRTANEFERTKNRDDLNKAYMLRAGLYNIFVILAYFLHGDEWSAKVGPVVWRFYGEKLSDYLEEFHA